MKCMLKRFICLSLLAALILAPIAMATVGTDVDAEIEAEETEEVAVVIDTTHLEEMFTAVARGTNDALAAGTVAEARWNSQIEAEGLDLAPTAFFEGEDDTPEEIAIAIATYSIAAEITELNDAPVQYLIVASSKNLREGPDRDYDRVGSLANGTIVTAFGGVVDGWVLVTNGEYTGWASTIHLAPFDGTMAPAWMAPVPEPGEETSVITPGEVGGAVAAPEGAPATSSGAGGGVAPAPSNPHEDDLFWLALTIQHEAGSNWLSDEHQLLVGNVVLNRVAHPQFPNTVHGVVHQPGQYPWAGSRHIAISDRAWANAQRLLNGERPAPANVVFQAQFPQGNGTFMTIHCSVLNSTTFFGYL